MARLPKALLCALLLVLTAVAYGQQGPTMLQTPRQAVLEMISGNPENVKKHLTLEVQNKLASALQDQSQNMLTNFSMARAAAGPDFQSFESGPVLFSFENTQQNERMEVRVDNDNMRGDFDEMDLSFHAFRDGKEQSLPLGFKIILAMKQQENIWRLNAITFSARVPVGDPKLYDPSTWNPAMLAGMHAPGMAAMSAANDAPPKMPPLRATRLIGLAENIYAQKHPQAGFTCNLADLVNIGKGMDGGESYSFIDPELGAGAYNGYRFTITGCGSSPAAAYQVIAEPLNGAGKAYCSDATRTLRSSEDGRGSTCLASGKLANR
jgi:hypothetical protein